MKTILNNSLIWKNEKFIQKIHENRKLSYLWSNKRTPFDKILSKMILKVDFLIITYKLKNFKNFSKGNTRKISIVFHHWLLCDVIKSCYDHMHMCSGPLVSYVHCVVPENIHIPTTEGIGNSEGLGGCQRPRKFWRGGGLDSPFGFQMVNLVSKILSFLPTK